MTEKVFQSDSQKRVSEVIAAIPLYVREDQVKGMVNTIEPEFLHSKVASNKEGKKLISIGGIIIVDELPVYFKAHASAFPSERPVPYLSDDTKTTVTKWSPHKPLSPLESQQVGNHASRAEMIYIMSILGHERLVEEARISNGLHGLYNDVLREHSDAYATLLDPKDFIMRSKLSAAISSYCDYAQTLWEHSQPEKG